MPGTSIGTKEAEAYIKLREQGQGRRKASKVFEGDKRMSINHPAVLDRSFHTAVERGKAIFSGEANTRLQGTVWIEELTGQNVQPIVNLNQYCLEHRVNCICFTRYNIHLFREKTRGITKPHNNGSPRSWKVVIDSW